MDPGSSSSAPPPSRPQAPVKSTKTMTKAERRELQEKQRAAKAASGGTKGGNKDSGIKQSVSGSVASSSGVGPASNSQPPRKLAPKVDGPKATHQSPGMTRMSFDASNVSVTQDKVRDLRIFSHFGLTKRTATNIKGEIHPAIVRLGLQFAEFKITGANARCIATLNAFKTVIQDYTTPQHETLSRHLLTYLSPQISYLVAARPMSVSMGNAIRQLKFDISKLSIDLPEQDAKDLLCNQIDTYIHHRIILADEIIESIAAQKIHDGDVILTYARSSVVERMLINAFREGNSKKRFSVVVVDSRPLLEGKKSLAVLSASGIPCTYLLLPALGSIIKEVTTVFVGAHALHSNGAVYSRAGTALVAMMAKKHSIPVVVCCETYKASGGVQLDSFTKNELTPSTDFPLEFPSVLSPESLTLRDRPNLQIINPLYDLTPPRNITAVVTEVGLIPPSSIASIPVAQGQTVQF